MITASEIQEFNIRPPMAKMANSLALMANCYKTASSSNLDKTDSRSFKEIQVAKSAIKSAKMYQLMASLALSTKMAKSSAPMAKVRRESFTMLMATKLICLSIVAKPLARQHLSLPMANRQALLMANH